LAGGLEDLVFVDRKEYTFDSNWKVFVDNYCDGGYHVPVAHGGLTTEINFDTYGIEIQRNWSLQTVNTSSERLGASAAAYAFLYPNFMINRYGPWMDTNTVIPIGHQKTKVIFDYFLRKDLASDTEYIKRSLEASEVVQREDEFLCEGVQAGLESGCYDQGRYVPRFEGPMNHFHRLLHANYLKALS